MEFKDLNLIKNQDNGFFCGYASVFNTVDSYDDIILNGAFNNSIKYNNIKLCWQHNINNIIGEIKTIKEDSIGLYIEGEIKRKDIYSYVKNGIIDGLSIGYNVNKSYIDSKNRRVLQDIDLKEISIVSFPANKHANITYCKAVNNKDYIKEIIKNIDKNINILKK